MIAPTVAALQSHLNVTIITLPNVVNALRLAPAKDCQLLPSPSETGESAFKFPESVELVQLTARRRSRGREQTGRR